MPSDDLMRDLKRSLEDATRKHEAAAPVIPVGSEAREVVASDERIAEARLRRHRPYPRARHPQGGPRCLIPPN